MIANVAFAIEEKYYLLSAHLPPVNLAYRLF